MANGYVTPGQLAQITGVSTNNQREWRRQGILPRNQGGWHHYTVGQAYTIAIMKALHDQGFTLAEARDMVAHVDSTRPHAYAWREGFPKRGRHKGGSQVFLANHPPEADSYCVVDLARIAARVRSFT